MINELETEKADEDGEMRYLGGIMELNHLCIHSEKTRPFYGAKCALTINYV